MVFKFSIVVSVPPFAVSLRTVWPLFLCITNYLFMFQYAYQNNNARNLVTRMKWEKICIECS